MDWAVLVCFFTTLRHRVDDIISRLCYGENKFPNRKEVLLRKEGRRKPLDPQNSTDIPSTRFAKSSSPLGYPRGSLFTN